jgi:hypothetical protein
MKALSVLILVPFILYNAIECGPIEWTLSFDNRTAYNWMTNNMGLLGDLKLKDICMPGSHDAGMFKKGWSTELVNEAVVVTQGKRIYDQLMNGIRYFDIRICNYQDGSQSNSGFYTGHFSKINDLIGYEGALGQSMAEIIEDINQFTQANNELIILDVSHDLTIRKREFDHEYTSFVKDDWYSLFAQMQDINYLFSTTDNLSQIPLKNFIGIKPAVFALIQAEESFDIGAYGGQGFYLGSQMPIYNSYSNTDDLQKMIDDQLNKMVIQSRSNQTFLLSWTLTQSIKDTLICTLTPEPDCVSIMNLAREANARVYDINSRITSSCFPNIILVDDAAVVGSSVLNVCGTVYDRTHKAQ